MLTKRLRFAAAVALLAACSDSTGTVTIPGVVTFTYSGGISGSYSATGNVPTTGSAIETTQWSAGELDTPSGAVYVVSASPRSSTSHDFVSMYISRTTTGTEDIDPNCSFNCTVVDVLFGAANSGGTTFLQNCFTETGSITITEITATRVKGTFTGTGICTDPTGTETSFTVTNGTFDVMLVASVE